MANIVSIKCALRPSRIKTRRLEITTIDPTSITAGNNAVTVRCRIEGRKGFWLLKCYFRPKPHLRDIYCEAYYPKELRTFSINGIEEYVDVVALPWVEGKPLDWHIGRPGTDYAALSRSFDKMALNLLESSFAHGDIKPDNIIVCQHNVMVLVDHDAEWRPEFDFIEPTEMGTLAYRHPRRDASYFNKHIDDYPIALISTALAALALDTEAMIQHIKPDKSLFLPDRCIAKRDKALEIAKQILLEHRDAPHYRIACCLHSPTPSLPSLRDYIYYAANPYKQEVPEWSSSYYSNGFWGYLWNDEWIIPPLYESCWAIHHGVAEVTLGETRFELPVEVVHDHARSRGRGRTSYQYAIPNHNQSPIREWQNR